MPKTFNETEASDSEERMPRLVAIARAADVASMPALSIEILASPAFERSTNARPMSTARSIPSSATAGSRSAGSEVGVSADGSTLNGSTGASFASASASAAQPSSAASPA